MRARTLRYSSDVEEREGVTEPNLLRREVTVQASSMKTSRHGHGHGRGRGRGD